MDARSMSNHCSGCGPTLHWPYDHADAKKIAEDVYLINGDILVHQCTGESFMKVMQLRESDDGPMYWCDGCGYVVDDGVAMAVRLYEAPFARSRNGN
jgi:hypothetical protein